MRNSSISYAARSALILSVCFLVAAGGVLEAKKGKKQKSLQAEDLTNFVLSPSYSQWLVGAVAQIASEDERQSYLKLTDDAQAAAFIEAFWRHRDDPSKPWPQEQVVGTFERRSREADKRFSEAASLGRRSDRGVIFILHGEPGKTDYIQQPPPRRENVEVWFYPKNTPPGLDGAKPDAQYFFVFRDGRTVRHTPRLRRPAPGSIRP